MDRNSWFAKVVDSDLGKFPGRLAEVISGFNVFKDSGWGKGISGRHLVKLIDRDESIFTTTWAKLRREYFRYVLFKLDPYSFNAVEVPLPCHPDGKVLSDKEIREKVRKGYRLMFYPVIKAEQLENSALISRPTLQYLKGDFCSEEDKKNWISDVSLSSRRLSPYWFWIDCSLTGSTIYSQALEHTFPTLIEYLITSFVFKEETGKPLDKDRFIWLHHDGYDAKQIIFGNDVMQRVPRSGMVDFDKSL